MLSAIVIYLQILLWGAEIRDFFTVSHSSVTENHAAHHEYQLRKSTVLHSYTTDGSVAKHLLCLLKNVHTLS